MLSTFSCPDAPSPSYKVTLHLGLAKSCALMVLSTPDWNSWSLIMRTQVVLWITCRLISRTSESLSMFTMVHLVLPAHVMSCPNNPLYWKCVSMGHLNILSHVIFNNVYNHSLSINYGGVYQCFLIHGILYLKQEWEKAQLSTLTFCQQLVCSVVSPISCPVKPQSFIRLPRCSIGGVEG